MILHWAIDTGTPGPIPQGTSVSEAHFVVAGGQDTPQCLFTNANLQACDLSGTLLPGPQNGASLVMAIGSGVGYFSVTGSAGDSVTVSPGATASLVSVEILDQNQQPLPNPPTLISRYGFSYQPWLQSPGLRPSRSSSPRQ